MNCYQCGNKLGSGRLCLKCGADTTIYRKIIHASNNCYNVGLEKAKLRDLTGAVEALTRSLQFNKKNTDARNLLGLVYFEMGEVVEALCQWVISKNLQPEDNLADFYLERLQEDRNALENMNQIIKKYNQALYQASHDGTDLAKIALKRILKQQPHYLKAYQLLALIYIKEEDYSKANRLLKKALKLDTGNTLCLRYSRLIRGKLGKPSKDTFQDIPHILMVEKEKEEPEVIAPKKKEKHSFLRTGLAVLAGMIIALCMYQFVILRTAARNANQDANEEIAAYNNRLSDKELEVQTLQDSVDHLEKQIKKYEKQMKGYTGDNGILTQYDKLLEIVYMYMDPDCDTDKLAEEFMQLTRFEDASETYTTVYDAMYQYVMVDRVEEVFNEGVELVNTDYYTQAIPVFERCLEMNADFDPALYYLGICYEHRHDTEKANTYFQQLVDHYPNSRYFDEALDRVGSVTPTAAVAPTAALGSTAGQEESSTDAQQGPTIPEDIEGEPDEGQAAPEEE